MHVVILIMQAILSMKLKLSEHNHVSSYPEREEPPIKKYIILCALV